MSSLLRRLRGALLVLPALSPATSLAAQAGHLPNESPYREIRYPSYIEVIGGHLYGNGGPLKVGARDGRVLGARMVFRGRNSLQLALGGWVSQAQRNIVDADASPATRVTGPIDQRLIGGEFTIQLNLTGGKTWHGLAPFGGVGLGLVHGQKSPAVDTSSYQFGTKLYFAPNVGTRFFVAQRLYIKAEARAYFWSLKYPASYSDEPANAPGTVDKPNAVNPTGKKGEYVAVPALLLGIGFKF